MAQDLPSRAAARAKFRATLVRVLIVQAVAIAILGLIQAVYNVRPG
jgi:hypothetical protein